MPQQNQILDWYLSYYTEGRKVRKVVLRRRLGGKSSRYRPHAVTFYFWNGSRIEHKISKGEESQFYLWWQEIHAIRRAEWTDQCERAPAEFSGSPWPPTPERASSSD